MNFVIDQIYHQILHPFTEFILKFNYRSQSFIIMEKAAEYNDLILAKRMNSVA